MASLRGCIRPLRYFPESMKKSIRFLTVLVILLHIFLLFLLLWAAAVPLEQIQQYAAENIGEIGDRVAFKGNLVQVGSLIWSATVFTAVIGFVIPWMIYRRVQIPILSIRNTIRQFSRGELEARVQVHAGKEFDALANELNRMMELQKQEQERLLDLNHTLSAISTCRHEMIQETDEKRLIQVCCRILVDIGAYRMAWIGYTEDDSHRTVTPAALAVYQNGSLNAVPASWVGTAFSPADRAIRNKHSAIINDVFNDPLFAPLQAEATRHGFVSIIALPLLAKHHVLGALTLYAGKPDAFGTEETRLLTELADDLAYGIHTIRGIGK
jgi:nitrate/nitrite-specific signal transduction histidine kinase